MYTWTPCLLLIITASAMPTDHAPSSPPTDCHLLPRWLRARHPSTPRPAGMPHGPHGIAPQLAPYFGSLPSPFPAPNGMAHLQQPLGAGMVGAGGASAVMWRPDLGGFLMPPVPMGPGGPSPMDPTGARLGEGFLGLMSGGWVGQAAAEACHL